MFNAARNWMDNLQTMAPGYRDRVVTVYLNKREGGLNLNMPHDVVTALSQYGELAAEKLIDHFLEGREDGEPTPMTWDNHRWVRYRSTMAQLDRFLEDLQVSVKNPEPGDRSYFHLIDRNSTELPDSYRFTEQQRTYASDLTQKLMDLPVGGSVLENKAPKPDPVLEIRPRF